MLLKKLILAGSINNFTMRQIIRSADPENHLKAISEVQRVLGQQEICDIPVSQLF